MQIISNGENLHETPNPFFFSNKKNINLSSAEYAQRMTKVNGCVGTVGRFVALWIGLKTIFLFS